MDARPRVILAPTGAEPPSYARGLRALSEEGVPFLVGGGLALAVYCGIRRNTKDLDLFVTRDDAPRVLEVLARTGLRTEVPFPHWLGKAYCDDGHFIDVIFSSGNGVVPVDAEWFAHATPAMVFGVPTAICPPEETVWTKAFVMERERFDGADIAHLVLACGATLDWDRLLRRFGEHWRVLYAHLVLFGYVFPDEAARIPQRVLDDLGARMRREHAASDGERLCRGTLLSREQYLPDLARGWRDARLPPGGSMTADAVAIWTDAIPRR